jgi:RNA polymerase sigma-70 factor (ECF subfamily)
MPFATLLHAEPHRMEPAPALAASRTQALDRFLRGVERRALRIAELSTRDREDALELVQDAMLSFARAYANKPEAEWGPLFHRVLDSRIQDHHRRSSVRRRWRVWFGRADDEAGEDPIEQVADPADPGPLARLADGQTRVALDAALRALPLRQRQAFLLRLWEGLDVPQTALAMRCSEGSVKTHLSRALAALRPRLEDLR